MSNTLTNFLIGIGTEYDPKGEKQAMTGISNVRSGILGIGATMSAIGIGAGVFARNIVTASDAMRNLDVSQTWIRGFNALFATAGGAADEGTQHLKDLSQQMIDINQNMEAVSGRFIELNKIIDPAKVQEYYDALRSGDIKQVVEVEQRILKEATPQQRIVAQEAFRITDVYQRVMLDREPIEAAVQAQIKLSGIDPQTEKNARLLSIQIGILGNNFDALQETVMNKIMPPLTEFISGINTASEEFREWYGTLSDTEKKVIDIFAAVSAGVVTIGAAVVTLSTGLKLLGTLTGGGGGTAATAAATAGKGLLKKAGIAGLAYTGAELAEPALDKALNAMFGGSEYFQNLRTAPDWGEFGKAVFGQRETTPEVAAYVGQRQEEKKANAYTAYGTQTEQSRGWNYGVSAPPVGQMAYNNAQPVDYEKLGNTMSNVKINNNVVVQGKIDLNGNELGEFVLDTYRTDQRNQQYQLITDSGNSGGDR